jgi:hypothetical protein
MRNSKFHSKDKYSMTDHAEYMFKEYCRDLIDSTNPVDMKPFADKYYADNIGHFKDIGRLAGIYLIIELEKLGYISGIKSGSQTVNLTDTGRKTLVFYQKHLDSIYGK